MMKEFKVGESRYGIIEGKDQVIITEPDCCYWLRPKDAIINLQSGGWSEYRDVEVAKALMVAQPIEDLSKWIHYFGIKARVRNNYRCLLSAISEIGLDPSKMPVWE